MTSVLRDVLPVALAIAASPFPIIPAILLLFAPRARRTSLGFVLGWVAGIAIATTAFVALASVIQGGDEPAGWASWSRLVLGGLLVVLGLSRWRGRHEKTETPRWMASLDALTPRKALRLGFLLAAANPKILLLAAAAGVTIGTAGLTTGSTVGVIAAFTAVASITVALPLILYVVLGDRMLTPLGRVRDWLQRNNAAVMAVVITAIGVVLVVKGVQGL